MNHGISNTYRWSAVLHLVQQHCFLISCWGTSITLSLTRIPSTEFLISFTAAPKTFVKEFDPATRHLHQASVYLVRSWRSRGQGAMEVALFFLLFHPYLRKRRYSLPEWRAERKEVLRGKILGQHWIFHHHAQYCNTFVPHPDCQLQTSPSTWMWHFHINTVIKDNRGHPSGTAPRQLAEPFQFGPLAWRSGEESWLTSLNWIWGETPTSRGFLPQKASLLKS